MYTVAILDDIPEHAHSIRGHTEAVFQNLKKDAEVMEYTDPGLFMKDLKKKPFSIYLIDVDLHHPPMTGIDIARNINAVYDAQIIFVSAFEEYYLDVYQTDHSYFIPKSRLSDLLKDALAKSIHHLEQEPHPLLPIHYNKKTFLVREDRIRYMEKILRKVMIYGEDTYQCYAKFEEVLRDSTTGTLVQCHKSYVVNTAFITTIERTSCTLTDGTVIPVSKKYYPDLIQKLTVFSGEQI